MKFKAQEPSSKQMPTPSPGKPPGSSLHIREEKSRSIPGRRARRKLVVCGKS